jgi:hypothetical protein
MACFPRFRRVVIPIMLIICLAPTFIFLGCSKITQENYNKLKIGMEYNEVLKILGKPDHCESVLSMKNCIWEESSKSITIKIIADKVVFLSSHGI